MKLEDQIARIATMSVVERKAEWRRVFGIPAPPAFGTGLMARAIAHRLQEAKFGSLASTAQRRLAKLGRKEKRERARETSTTSVKPGTWLSRTWHGEVHQVVVLDTGFEYRGARYLSLSAIARHITGVGWSGPRFFGLNSPRLGKLGVTANG